MMSLKYLNNKYSQEADLKRHYRELTKLYHPDKGGELSKFIELKKEYDLLLNLLLTDLTEFKLLFYFKHTKAIDGLKFKVAYLDGVLGDGTLKNPFIGLVQSKYYKDWLIYYKNDNSR